MHRTLRLHIVALLLGLLATPASLSAQPAPIHFTANLGYDNVHGFARIQSAAIRNATTLVVWGATRAAADGTSIGELYYQRLRSGESGLPRLLLDPSFRPASFVAVLPLEGGFLVWWNDLRPDRPGLYTQRLDLDGELVGAPAFFHASSISDTANVRMLIGPSGRTIVWNDGDRRLFVHRIARDGTVLIDRVQVGTGMSAGARRLLGIDDLVALPTDNGVVTIDGLHRIAPAATSRGILDGIHRILPDSSFAWMRDSTVFVARSLYQNTAIDTFVLPVPKSVLAYCALSVSTAGALELSWPVVYDVPNVPRTIAVDIARVDVRRRPPEEPRRLATISQMIDVSNSRTQYLRFISMQRTYHCDNSTVIVYMFEHTTYLGGGRGTDVRLRKRGHIIASDGSLTADGPVAPVNGACPETDTAFRSVAVVRVAGGLRRSAVRVAGVVLSAPSEPVRRNTAESAPNVVLAGDTVRVAFASKWGEGHFGLIDWYEAGAEVSPEIAALGNEPDRNESEALMRVAGASIITRSAYTTSNPYPFDGRSEAILMSPSWTRLFVDGSLSIPPQTYGVSFDRTEIAAYRQLGASVAISMRKLESAPRWATTVADAGPWHGIVAIDSGRALLVRSAGSATTTARIVGPGITSKPFAIDETRPMLAVLPAGADEFFLLCGGRTNSALRLSRVRSDGTILSSSNVEPLPGGVDLFSFVDPHDTTVVLVASTTEGIHLARLGPKHPSNPWVKVFADVEVYDPSAIYHGDSLYIAWTKHLGRDSDIEGIALARASLPTPAPDPPSDPPPASSVAGSLAFDGIFPTPTTVMATIRLLIGAPSAITLEIFDARGERVEVRSFVAYAGGPHDLSLDVTQYLNGIYTVRATSGQVSAETRLNVVHDWK